MSKTIVALSLLAALAAVTFVACGGPSGSQSTGPSAEGAKYILQEAPPTPRSVADVVQNAQHDEDIVVIGRIGGQEDPWDPGLASFTIADEKLTPCNERPGDTCDKPWDYCCDLPLLPTHTLPVSFADERGRTIETDARKLLGVEALQTVVVRGKAVRENNNVRIVANGVFVKR